MGDPIRVVYVEERSAGEAADRGRADESFQEFASDREFASDTERLIVESVSTVDEAIDRLAAEPVDCIVSGYHVADRNGVEFLEYVREHYPAIPFVLFTEEDREDVVSAALTADRTDYVRRDGSTMQYTILTNRIESAVEAASVETPLERSRQLLRQTERLAGTGGWEADVETGEQRWTEGLFDIHDIDVDEPANRHVPTVEEYLSLVESDQRAAFREAITHCIEDGEPYDEEIRITTDAGNTRWIRTVGEPVVHDGEVVALRGAARDVTEQKERERKLQELAEYQEAIIESANEWINVLDAEGNVVVWNPAAAEISGYSAEEVVGHGRIWEWLYPDEAYRQEILGHVEDILQDDKSVTEFETTIRRKDGERRIISWYSQRIAYGDGEGKSSVAIGRDVTERKCRIREIERQATELEAQNERLEQFTSIVSHDLRNPLNVADGSLELAREECESEYLDDVQYSLDRMNDLVDDLLTLARKGHSGDTPEPVDLAELATACWYHVETGDATLETPADLRFMADRSRLQQLLENLVRNAVEHGGEDVTVTVGTCDGGFYVADDGPGIPPGNHERVFEVGFSTNRDGTGLGLSIVEQVADAHGWDVRITEGSTGGARIEIVGVTDHG